MEQVLEMPPDTTDVPLVSSAGRLSKERTRTRKGKARLLTLAALDGRTAAYADARKLVRDLSVDLGGEDRLSAGEHQLVTRAALVGAIVADFEARWVAGQVVPLADYLSAVNVQRRVLATLGLQRRQRTVGETLSAESADWSPMRAAAIGRGDVIDAEEVQP